MDPRRITLVVLVMGLMALLGLPALFAERAGVASPLPFLVRFPEFSLQSADGKVCTQEELLGATSIIRIVSAEYASESRVAEECALALAKAPVRLYAVQPESEVESGEDPGVAAPWRCLVGSREEIDRIARCGLGVENHEGDRMALVDSRGLVRGVYDATNEGCVEDLMHDLRSLENEGSGE